MEKCDFYGVIFYFNCDNINSLAIDTSQVTNIESFRIKPKTFMKFDNSLNLSSLNGKFQDNLENFDEFVLEDNPFLKFERGELLELSNFKLNFTGASIINLKPLFSSFENLVFNSKIIYSNQLSPWTFNNANLKRILMNNLTDNNNLIILQSNLNNFTSNVQSLEILNSSISELKNDLLNEFVFKYLEKFVYHSTN